MGMNQLNNHQQGELKTKEKGGTREGTLISPNG